MALGRPWVRIGFELTGVTVLVVASMSLSHTLGTQGIALALSTAEWSMSIIGWIYVTYMVGTQRSRQKAVDTSN